MARMIKLHHYISGNSIWLNPDAIISVVDDAPTEGTSVYTYAYASDSIHYHVAETAETVIGLIEQACNPLDSYTCAVPKAVSWEME